MLIHSYMNKSELFQFLADESRLKIISLLSKKKEGLCVKEIAEKLKLTHSATSHQLSKLEARGIVSSCRQGQRNCYKIEKGPLTEKIIKIIKVS